MEEIERTVNNVQEYFMSFDKHFHSLATTVRSEAERYYEYEVLLRLILTIIQKTLHILLIQMKSCHYQIKRKNKSDQNIQE